MAGSNCYNNITLRQQPSITWLRDQQVSNLCFLGHLWLADWCHQWLSERWSYARFVVKSFFLVTAFAYRWRFLGFFGVTIVEISLRQLAKLCKHHSMNIFQQLFQMVKVCMAVCSTQLRSMDIFEHKHFTRWCSNAFQGQRDILLSSYYKFIAKYDERISKIDLQVSAKI